MLDVTPAARAQAFLDRFGEALAKPDIEAAVAMFAEDSYWRDLVSFTWNIKTMEGREQIRDMLAHCLARREAARLARRREGAGHGGRRRASRRGSPSRPRSRAATASCASSDGLIWTLLTTMVELKGHEEKAGFTRPLGAQARRQLGAKSWKERREEEAATLGYAKQPYVVIIGGGQGGIALGARLRQLGVPTIIVEKNERAGDTWRKRYKSLCLHDPVWYDHLPYIDFPKNWPVFSPKDKIGDWLEMYAKVMELNYWTKSDGEIAPATTRRRRNGPSSSTATARRSCCVRSSSCSRPACRARPTCRTSRARRPSRASSIIPRGIPAPTATRARRSVVIGSNNSAHDICAALYENGVDVTMVQRSTTHIVRSDSLMEIGLGDLYSERAVQGGMTTAKADLIFASLPYAILHTFQKPVYDKIREVDADFYKALEKAGFKLDFGDDDSGLFMKYLRRGSGYYIDVGASQLIIDGKIKLVAGQVEEITPTGVKLDNGRGIPADVIVYATGYGSMNGWVADLCGQEMADKVGKVLGPRLRHAEGPGPVGRRAAQHVEADAAGGAVDARRQPAPVAPLFAVPVAAAEGALRGRSDAGLRAAAVVSQELNQAASRADPLNIGAIDTDVGRASAGAATVRPGADIDKRSDDGQR